MTAAEPEAPESRNTGRVVAGVLLVLLGIGWLIDAFGVAIPWAALLPAALILVGVALLVTARRGGHGGLVVLGVILSLIMAAGVSVGATFHADVSAGGVGDRTETPASVEELAGGYQLGVGKLTVDLRDVDFPPGTTEVSADVGVGELIILVPNDVDVRVTGDVLVGEVRAGDVVRNGFGADIDELLEAQEPSERTLVLTLDVVIGNAEVRR